MNPKERLRSAFRGGRWSSPASSTSPPRRAVKRSRNSASTTATAAGADADVLCERESTLLSGASSRGSPQGGVRWQSGRRRVHPLVLVVLVGSMWSTVSVTAPAQAQAQTVSVPLRSAVAGLPVAVEERTGYDRDLFPHWIDEDRDGCHTRREVLITEATTPPVIGPQCAIVGGQWYSYYDDATWSDQADLDIDHVVALAEAWDSGASRWTTVQRRAYANDLGDERSLVAVTDNVNQAKADQDPATWIPPYEPARCRFIGEWVTVKLRWRLTVDTSEKAALTTLADSCPDETISFTHAI